MTYKTADNVIVPEPMLRHIHKDSFFKTSEDRQVTLAVLEVRQPSFTTLTLCEVTEGYEVFGAEYLTGILAMRLAEGCTIHSASERHYVLFAPPQDVKASGVRPTCPICGSEHIIRDAGAHWDKQAGQWALADLQDYHFCETCNAESEFAAWTPVTDPDGAIGAAAGAGA